MKYPFSPDVLDAMPEKLADLYRNMGAYILEEICKQLQIGDSMNESTLQKIRALRAQGINLAEIEKAILANTNLTKQELKKLFSDVVKRNQTYYNEVIDKAKLTVPETLVAQKDIDAIAAQTAKEFSNITQSMGFLINVGGRPTMLPPAKAYQWALDNATLQVQSGVTDYTKAIRYATQTLADSGIRTVDYESGHIDQIDVAVRRAIMTGVSQVNAKYTEAGADVLETDYFEVSAHRGARDKGMGWQNHKEWQGKVYSTKSGDKYPNIYTVCGLGAVDGLEGANCRHRRFPFVEGVSERTYTDEDLQNIDTPPFKYQGRTYTAYEATQKQREIERTVRKLKRREVAFKAAGLHDDAKVTKIRRMRLEKDYKAFSATANLPLQTERMKIYP